MQLTLIIDYSVNTINQKKQLPSLKVALHNCQYHFYLTISTKTILPNPIKYELAILLILKRLKDFDIIALLWIYFLVKTLHGCFLRE